MSNIKIPFWKKFINLFAHHIKITIVLVILAGFTVFRLVNGQAALFDKSSELEAVYVELGAAHFGNMRELGRYYGSLSAPSHFVLSAKVGGEIKSLKVNIGDKLNNGELVAVIDDEEYVIARDRAAMAVKLAEAQLSEAEANLSLADSDLKRQTSLIEKNIVPHAEFEAAENRHLQAQARLAVAESQLQSASNQLLDAELKLSYTQVAASWPNEDSANENLDDFRYVGTRLVNEGQLVAPNSPLFDIVSLNPLLVEVDVIEKDYPKIHVGMEATISTEAFPTETFKGKVLRIAPVLSSDSRQARLELLVDNQDLKLKPGMYANVVFVFNEHENVWSVDVDTPFRKQDGYIIFVADKSTGTVKMINVELGLVENGMVELVGVPSIDGPVVVLGQHLLQDGQLFKVAGESDSSAAPKM